MIDLVEIVVQLSRQLCLQEQPERLELWIEERREVSMQRLQAAL
jgi:hypothetical protein